MISLLPGILSGAELVEGLDANLRLNELQYIGTHNSYHIAMGDALAILLQAAEYDAGEGWDARRLIYSTDYTHPSLTTQLCLGLRQFELDVYADPEGGRFLESNLIKLLDETPWNLPFGKGDLEQLKQPGFKVLHNPEYDPRSTNYLLSDSLKELLQWSNEHPEHLPIIVHVEVKESSPRPLLPEFEAAPVLQFDHQLWLDLENCIREIIPKDKRVEPDMIRGEYRSLRKAIEDRGWPRLEELKGKFLFFLLNKKPQTVSYMKVDQELQGRLFFSSLTQSASAASWFRVPDPDYPYIPDLLSSGFLVTTMADQHTRHSRENDTRQKKKAFQAGAQFILTDYPVPDRRFSDYHVKFSNNLYVRENPVTSSLMDLSISHKAESIPELDFGPVCGGVTVDAATFCFGMQFIGDVGRVVLSKEDNFNKVIFSEKVIATEERVGI